MSNTNNEIIVFGGASSPSRALSPASATPSVASPTPVPSSISIVSPNTLSRPLAQLMAARDDDNEGLFAAHLQDRSQYEPPHVATLVEVSSKS
jgi:hypothetical protein